MVQSTVPPLDAHMLPMHGTNLKKSNKSHVSYTFAELLKMAGNTKNAYFNDLVNIFLVLVQ